jgi:hypothetical protein
LRRSAKTLWGNSQPRNFQHLFQVISSDAIQVDENRGVAAIVVGREKSARIGLHAKVAFNVTTLDDEGRVVIA